MSMHISVVFLCRLFTKIVGGALDLLIRMYQLTLSAFIGRTCRFYPTCSIYAREALREHGAWRGGWLAIKRIGRCNPWLNSKSGYDPVPSRITDFCCADDAAADNSDISSKNLPDAGQIFANRHASVPFPTRRDAQVIVQDNHDSGGNSSSSS